MGRLRQLIGSRGARQRFDIVGTVEEQNDQNDDYDEFREAFAVKFTHCGKPPHLGYDKKRAILQTESFK